MGRHVFRKTARSGSIDKSSSQTKAEYDRVLQLVICASEPMVSTDPNNPFEAPSVRDSYPLRSSKRSGNFVCSSTIELVSSVYLRPPGDLKSLDGGSSELTPLATSRFEVVSAQFDDGHFGYFHHANQLPELNGPGSTPREWPGASNLRMALAKAVNGILAFTPPGSDEPTPPSISTLSIGYGVSGPMGRSVTAGNVSFFTLSLSEKEDYVVEWKQVKITGPAGISKTAKVPSLIKGWPGQLSIAAAPAALDALLS